MYCESCGKQINDDAKFCPYCGKPVNHTGKESDEDVRSAGSSGKCSSYADGKESIYTFSVSPLFFWLKGKAEVGVKVTTISTPNTILGIIPAGYNKQTIPMSNVSSVQIRNSVKLSRVAAGIVFLIISFMILTVMSDSGDSVTFIFFILTLFIGVDLIIDGLPNYLDVETGGKVRTFYAPVYARKSLMDIEKAMNRELLHTEDRRDVSQAADRIINAMGNGNH